MLVIAIYDVPAKRTSIYRKLLRSRLEHIQYSVFFGELTEGQVTELKQKIEQKLEPDDAVIIFEAEQSAAVDYTTFGDAESPGSRFT
ncbi:CRISPR-associated endonuclease Cas2 [Halosegnis longus]|uniref:CRISPR-associated endonuclease Cas2 n=1 Tax=Halosegnis longus TaxID=2216012 RepID=UPI00096AACA2|nr:CRISPR-associated endonuclease Cas2 [Salella cibi]